MTRAAARWSGFALLLGVAACSMPVLTDREVDACKTQIKLVSGFDLSTEDPAGWSVNVVNSSRSTVVSFEATSAHPVYVCNLEENVVTAIIEQRLIYQQPG